LHQKLVYTKVVSRPRTEQSSVADTKLSWPKPNDELFQHLLIGGLEIGLDLLQVGLLEHRNPVRQRPELIGDLLGAKVRVRDKHTHGDSILRRL